MATSQRADRMRWPRSRSPVFAVLSLCFALGAWLAAAQAAAGGERLRGTVVQVQSPGVVMVRHDAYGGMPGMTMLFRLPPGVAAHAGDVVTATVDRRTDPWSLRGVRLAPGSGTHGSAARRAPSPRARLGVGDRVPDVAFVDQRNRPFALPSLRGARYALSFVYTRCQDARMCPLLSAKYRRVQGDPAVASSHLVEVTLDPAYDSSTVLARYGRTFGADPRRWHLLTGDAARVHAFAAAFGVEARANEGGILHTERTVVVDADGRIERFLDDPVWAPSDLSALLGRRESAWQRLAFASHGALAWCGEHLGASGRTAVHHTAVILLPILVLALPVAGLYLVETRSARKAARR